MIDDKSLQTLKLIQKHRIKGDFLTYEEMGQKLGITKSSAKARVVKLEAMGLVQTEPRKARKVALTDEGIKMIAFSLLTLEQQQTYLDATPWWLKKTAWWLAALDDARHGNFTLEDDDGLGDS